MKNLLLLSLVFLFSCAQENTEWKKIGSIPLGEVTPIGMAYSDGHLWLSDGDHNQIVAIDLEGKVIQTLDGFERPMHLSSQKGKLFIPEYGSDQIILLENGRKSVLELPDSLDAPAGIDVVGAEMAIADFYNHRVLYYDGKEWIIFGKEGKENGAFYYPTDIAIVDKQLIVADAYNNRVQVFDKEGGFLKSIGTEEKINAATGVFADENRIVVTDFENDRVLVYDRAGILQQIISEGIDKPTDILLVGDELLVANYKGKNITRYSK